MEEAGADPVRWRLAYPDRVRVVRLGQAAIIFNPLSWQTHYLNEAAYCVFDALAAGPLDMDHLVAATVEAHEALSAEERDECRQTLLSHLADMVTMGLLVRQPGAAA